MTFLLDLTLPTPAENLALDEALLDEAEAAPEPIETLRLWEPAAPMVVVGRSSKVANEVCVEACRRLAVPVLRRTSGGAAVVTGPGCLMYALVLSLQRRPSLRMVEHAHRVVLDRIAAALAPLAPRVCRRGTSDLALGDDKFSGNSIRMKQTHLLYHGTLLYDFPLRLIDECLAMPPRQPEYRKGRGHRAFVTNLAVPKESLRRALVAAWTATQPRCDWPRDLTAQLVALRYTSADWNGL
ncbi:MAG: lipoate--protein ligase family protein [Thermoguttaceae bacterium]|jgi:lipoate-protein ligase A|nr:lipoate--protein ligase family protein [Thermoguttaceae bacterium]